MKPEPARSGFRMPGRSTAPCAHPDLTSPCPFCRKPLHCTSRDTPRFQALEAALGMRVVANDFSRIWGTGPSSFLSKKGDLSVKLRIIFALCSALAAIPAVVLSRNGSLGGFYSPGYSQRHRHGPAPDAGTQQHHALRFRHLRPGWPAAPQAFLMQADWNS